MSHFTDTALVQQFRGFQRVGRLPGLIFGGLGLEKTD
jgi:hypothetical protein